jgi:hypothetical protein
VSNVSVESSKHFLQSRRMRIDAGEKKFSSSYIVVTKIQRVQIDICECCRVGSNSSELSSVVIMLAKG